MVRLLFDEPLSEALCKMLADIYPGSLHVRLLGESGAADTVVWGLARTHSCVLVSKDEDFVRLAVLQSQLKFVWIRRGNCTTREIAELLRRCHDDVVRFSEQDETTVLELS
jgi:predicted nuclease of predicted toxin-antitoxin system